MRHRSSLLAAALVALAWPGFTHAGVVNPDISLIGQPVATWSDDPRDIRNYRRLNLSAGETEIVFDSALNPYARGFATLSLADGKADVEEAFFTILRGLPGGIEVKGGKYRVGFGKLNAAHYGQQHITFRRLGTSVPIAEFSPAFLHIILESETLGECHHSRQWMPSASNFSTPSAPGA